MICEENLTLLPKTRHSLLLRLSNDNSVAWQEFVEVYELAIYRFALRGGLQPVDAEDVTQQVLTAVVDKVKKWDPDASRGSFGAWLVVVTRNLAARARNNRAKSSLLAADLSEGNFDDLAVVQDTPEFSEFDIEYQKSLFHCAANRVSGKVQLKTWRAFWLTAVKQIDAGLVARQLDISIASVYTAKCRVLDRVKREVGRIEGEISANFGVGEIQK